MTADYISIHDHAYNFLVYYFLTELSETEFNPAAAAGDERFSISQYLAALGLCFWNWQGPQFCLWHRWFFRIHMELQSG